MAERVKITVLVEGGKHPDLKGSWELRHNRPLVGLSLYVEAIQDSRTYRILMDVGTTWKRLRHNAETLGVDLDRIDCGVLSHWHFDHTGALPALLRHIKSNPPFYVPVREPSLSLLNAFIEKRLPPWFNRVEVGEPREILPGIFSTGCFETSFPLQRHPVHEQALYIPIEGKGLVLLVGCSHPSPQDLARKALELSGESKIALLLGGLHFIAPTTEEQKDEIVRELKKLDITKIAPCHCTGTAGTARLEEEFGEKFLRVALGGVYEVEA